MGIFKKIGSFLGGALKKGASFVGKVGKGILKVGGAVGKVATPLLSAASIAIPELAPVASIVGKVTSGINAINDSGILGATKKGQLGKNAQAAYENAKALPTDVKPRAKGLIRNLGGIGMDVRNTVGDLAQAGQQAYQSLKDGRALRNLQQAAGMFTPTGGNGV